MTRSPIDPPARRAAAERRVSSGPLLALIASLVLWLLILGLLRAFQIF
jgi:hypothetical protein